MLRRTTDIKTFWPLFVHAARQVKEPLDVGELKTKLTDGEWHALIDPPVTGVIIVAFRVQPVRHVFIWLAWAKAARSVLREYSQQLEDMARASGAAYLEMHTRRKGFARFGWQAQGDFLYRKEL